MPAKKVIAVTGATGAQGGGLVRAILADKDAGFTARAITRDPGSAKARALAEAGAEVVAANVDDQGSLEEAFAGADAAFCVTFFWDHFSAEREFQQASNLALAAAAAGVKHVIWSTLEDTRTMVPLSDDRMPTLQGKYKVPHFDAKGEADAVFAGTGVPTTCLLTSFYWDNFIFFGAGPKRGEDGVLTLTMPMADKPLASIAADDIGRCAYGILKRGEEFAGKRIGIAGGHLTGAQLAEHMGRAIGETVRYQDVPHDVYRGFGFPGADDLGNMFQVYVEFADHFARTRDVALSRELNPALQDYETWLSQHARQIPLG
jgi:uncharacterized protein YbjT (DUF2867 family)